MKLFYSPNSPFARKCRVAVIEKALEHRVELISVMPSDNPPELLEVNPLGTVPALLISSGRTLCESPVICEYMDNVTGSNILFPNEKNPRFEALSLAALADGIMDAAVACVMEGRRPEEKRYPAWVERKEKAIMRTIAELAKYEFNEKLRFNIGSLNTAVALSYVKFRLPHLDWENKYQSLTDWLEVVNERPSMLNTTPVA